MITKYKDAIIKETELIKVLQSPTYNYAFNKQTGYFARWGSTRDDNPSMSPYGPEICDIEISTGGDCIGCTYCYKSVIKGKPTFNMSLSDFKRVFHSLPPSVTQIAFGILQISTNPDFFPIMQYSRDRGVIPNYTCNGYGVTKEIAELTSKLCGAVAVSVHILDVAYNAIKRFTDAGMTQCNIHAVLHNESYEQAFKIIDDMTTDSRLAKMNALIFLKYKPKGNNAGKFTGISIEQYRKLIEYADSKGIRYGMDSCSAPVYMKAIESNPKCMDMITHSEPCESMLFSTYINTFGEVFPCSFTEDTNGWETGISLLDRPIDFLSNVWYNPRVNEWRDRLLESSSKCDCKFKGECRSCPIYEITPCKGDSK